MTPENVTSLIGVLVTMTAATAAYLQSRINAKKSDIISQKADEIHSLADGNLSRVSNQLILSNEKIHGLEKLVSQLVIQANSDLQAKVALAGAAALALQHAQEGQSTTSITTPEPTSINIPTGTIIQTKENK